MDKQYKRLDKFLFCCRLETGGYVFGWLGIIHCILATILFVLIIFGLTSDSITDDTFQSMGFGNQRSTPQDMTNIRQGLTLQIESFWPAKLKMIFSAFMIVSIVGIIGSLFYFVISVVLIFGTKNVRIDFNWLDISTYLEKIFRKPQSWSCQQSYSLA